jgi:hypothetical protein
MDSCSALLGFIRSRPVNPNAITNDRQVAPEVRTFSRRTLRNQTRPVNAGRGYPESDVKGVTGGRPQALADPPLRPVLQRFAWWLQRRRNIVPWFQYACGPSIVE